MTLNVIFLVIILLSFISFYACASLSCNYEKECDIYRMNIWSSRADVCMIVLILSISSLIIHAV